MQCIVNDKVSQGIGPNKKTAKKIAAEAMLVIMGHEPSVGVSSSFCFELISSSRTAPKKGSLQRPKERTKVLHYRKWLLILRA
jgi:hypothetical protein